MGWGFRLPPYSDLWERHFQRLWAPGWLHCPSSIGSKKKKYPQSSRISLLSWSPASHRHTEYPNAATSLQCNCTHLLRGGCARLQVSGGETSLKWCGFAHGNGWLPEGNWSEHSDKLLATLLNCQLYFWLLQAGVSAIEKKKKDSLKLKQRDSSGFLSSLLTVFSC